MDYILFLILFAFSFISATIAYVSHSRIFFAVTAVGFLFTGLMWFNGVEMPTGEFTTYNYTTINTTDFNSTGDISGYHALSYLTQLNKTTTYQTFTSNSTVLGGFETVVANPNQYNYGFGIVLLLVGLGLILSVALDTFRGRKKEW